MILDSGFFVPTLVLNVAITVAVAIFIDPLQCCPGFRLEFPDQVGPSCPTFEFLNLFMFEPKGDATQITWELDGENVFALKVMTIFVSVDRLMGSHFERGLAGLKTAAEKSSGDPKLPGTISNSIKSTS